MRNLLEYILIHLVAHPEDVVVEERIELDRHSYDIHVHPEDIGRVIGRQGRVIEAIRTLAKVRAMVEGILVNVRVIEPNEDAAPELEGNVEQSTPEVSDMSQDDAPEIA